MQMKIYGKCVATNRVFFATVVIEIETGLITEVHRSVKLEGAFDVKDCLIFPGFLDVHVHGREDATGKETHKETFETLGEASINGGVVHVVEMGNNPKPPVDDDSYLEKQELTKKSKVPITLYAMIGPGTSALSFNVPYKLCHARTTGSNDIIFFPNRKEIEETVKRYRGKSVSHHCEDSEILKGHENEPFHELRRPPEAEVSAIDFAVYLTEKYNLKSKVCHCSVCAGIDKIDGAKKQGLDVTCEITPHHLYFDQSMTTEETRPWMQMNPPLRVAKDRLFCVWALRNSFIDMVATDHAPHTKEDKLKGASGQPHLDTFGPFITWLMAEHRFRPEDIARVCCVNPARFLNQFLSPKEFGKGYGKIAVGYVGSLTVIDPKNPITINEAMLKTKCAWSPFNGIAFPGRVTAVVVRGQMYAH